MKVIKNLTTQMIPLQKRGASGKLELLPLPSCAEVFIEDAEMSTDILIKQQAQLIVVEDVD